MMIYEKDIDQIAEDDLQALVANSVSEMKRIDYKQVLPGNKDSDKKEFLADVSSLANASGGVLIFGMVEEAGTPKSLIGIVTENVDQEISRLENLIRDGIRPRISNLVTRHINLNNGRVALVIKVPKSWISPHRVILEGHDKFYSRSSNGKYPLDVDELRIAFNFSETVTERIRSFRLDRISKIYANETPVPFYDGAKTVLHLIPLASFQPARSYDITAIASHSDRLQPMYSSGWSPRYNLDGFLTYSQDKDGKSYSYVQLFRSGIIEAVEAHLLQPWQDRDKVIPSVKYEEVLIESVKVFLGVLKTLTVEPPVFVFLDLLGVKGYSMAVRNYFHHTETIDRDALLLPEVIIENYDANAEKVLKQCFDSIWNACGFPKDPYYDSSGNWVRPR